jgi:TonB-linked SusC/RagA family outer membrane protein
MRHWGKYVPVLALAAFALFAVEASPAAAQQTGTVTGTVTDAGSGTGLESAQVFLPNLDMGGLTNNAGRFLLLNIPSGTHELRVELIGYGSASQTVTVSPGQTTNVNFTLTSSALRLQELVVTGVAGSTPRVKLPFTVEKVDMEEQPVQTSGADELIQGKVAGVEVVKGSGQPGNAADIMLRGPTSLTGSQSPLVIVDGVITDNTLADIDALDIASIEVVKGAAASSLYGSRAANGVIQIQTKRASGLATDLSRVTLREELGTNNIEGDIALAQYHHYKMTADGQSFVDQYGNPQDYKAGVVLDDGGTSFTAFQDNPFPGKTYDHLDRFFRPGRFQRDYIAVDGKSGNTSYRASFTNSAETGVLEGNSGFTRRNLRVNVDHEVWSNLDLSLSTFYAQTKQEDIGGNPFFALTFMSPNIDLTQKDEDGYYLFNADPLSLEENPLYPIQFIQNWDRRTRFMGSLFVRFRPTGWFELEGNYSLDRQDYNQTNLTPKGYKTVDNPTGGLGSIWKWNGIENDINASVTASINYAFGDLTTRTKFRYLMEDQHSEEFDAQGNDLTVADIPVLDVAAGGKDVGSYLSDVISEGYYAISSLDYQGKYVADALIRRDGSSLFGADERWQTYYRGSLAWRMAQEDWWPLEVLDEFKLRYSYGTAGDRPGFAAQYETYSVSAGSISPVNLGNVNLKPAFAKEQEIGIDMVWFNQVAAGVTYARHGLVQPGGGRGHLRQLRG